MIGSDFLHQFVQLLHIDIALEGMRAGGIMRLVNDDVHEMTAGNLLVQTGRGEIHVAWYVITLPDHDLRHQVLSAAALVRGHQVLVTVILLDGGLEVIVILAAGIGLVTHHQAGPLAVAHRGRA